MADILQHLLQAIRHAAIYNPDVQVAPSCILWPDGDRQWEPVAARLQAEVPEMFVLGDYDVEKRTGPAIWLRCVIANKAPKVEIPSDSTLVLYLPGVSRQDLRAVESCPDHLKPLAELQYSGVIWSQINAKDWTILAFLKSDQGGLGLDVAQDNDTRHAMQLALYRLLDEDIDLLKGKRLDKDYFNTLLTGGDPVRDLLQWLDQGDAFKTGRDENAWIGFVEVCKSQLAFDPENDGNLKGAELLAGRKGPWLPVWERFCEAPKRYAKIPAFIRQCSSPQTDLFSNAETHGSWPQWNERQEKALRGELLLIQDLPPHQARNRINELGSHHKERRKLVWAELGEAPLACAVEHLATLAKATGNPLTAGTATELAEAYRSSGWQADDAVLRALACVSRQEDFEAVKTVIRAVYLTWVEDAARYLQKVLVQKEYPGNRNTKAAPPSKKAGECILFVDGLRFDAARRLSEMLKSRGLSVEETSGWAAIPTVTATGKPAVTPVAHLLAGQEVNADFEPCVALTGQPLKGGYHLQKLLADEGWHLLGKLKGDGPQGAAWCEVGNIDHEGHERGWQLAKHLEALLGEIAERIEQLLSSDFKTIRVVTDHGWLLMPGGLPKAELPSCLTENAWGRCAALKPGASTDERLFPWFWNPHQEFALADGISCYRAGMEYAHGGLSLQECLTPGLTVCSGHKARFASEVRITDVTWKGLRCKVALEGEVASLFLDLRAQPGNPSTSIVMGVKPFKEDGTSSVVVVNEDMEGLETTLVVLDCEGRLVAQRSTVIAKEGD
jgi:hypothetical protein